MEVQITDKIDLNQLEETSTRGHFTEELYRNLPDLIKDGISVLNGNDKEVFLVSSLAVLSSCLPNLSATYDGQAIESNLYLFLYGPFGTGKGAAVYARNLVNPVHKYLREQLLTPEPGTNEQPQTKLHIIPANSSKSGAIELLARNGRGLIFESEADTLTDILKQDYGNFSDVLRKAYHHENISFYRRINKEYIDIESPKLSVLLSGTPSQLRRLIPSVENGLFSRFCYFGLEPEPAFKNVFDTSKGDLNKYFTGIGTDVLELYKGLEQLPQPLIFDLQDHQKAEFLDYFQMVKTSLIDTYGDVMAGSVNRFGVQFFRIAMLLTSLRIIETGELPLKIECSDQDYNNTKLIMDVFTWHALNVYDSMAVSNLDNLPVNKRTFYEALPTEFQTFEAVRLGLVFDISESTVKRFIDNRQLFEYVRHGQYKRKL